MRKKWEEVGGGGEGRVSYKEERKPHSPLLLIFRTHSRFRSFRGLRAFLETPDTQATTTKNNLIYITQNVANSSHMFILYLPQTETNISFPECKRLMPSLDIAYQE